MKSFLRKLALVAAVVIIALAVLSLVNYRRIDAGGLKAGVAALVERNRELEKRARPEYQEHALAALAPNAANGAYYRLDEHVADARVVAAPELNAGRDPGVLYRLEFADPKDSGLTAPKKDVALENIQGTLRIKPENERAYVTNETAIPVRREEIGDIVIRARATQETRLTLGWSATDPVENPFQYSVDVTLEKSPEFRTYVINARGALKFGLAASEPVAHIYLRAASTGSAAVDIDFVRFMSRQSLYLSAANGTTYETIGGELRPVLYMLPNQHLSWRVAVPQNAPRLTLGQALLTPGKTARCSVTVTEGGKAVTLHEVQLATSEQWQDYSLDLTRWAGRTVELGLHAEAAEPDIVTLWSSPMVRSTPVERFNVVMILEDALRADYLSAYGYSRDTSPSKSKLMAERGVLFEHAFSQAEKTRPSVPALMTGLYVTTTNVWHFSDLLSDRYLTLAEILRSQGFTTASFLQNGNAGPYGGLHQGFDSLRDEKLSGIAAESMFAGDALQWLDRHRDENFFLYLHVIDPHGPYDPPAPFNAWYENDKGKGKRVKADFRRHEPQGMDQPTDIERRARYAGEIRHNDSLVPGLFAQLQKLGLSENTLVIFLADHGEYLGEHGLWEHRPPSLTPVIHVPLMMVYPKRFAQAKRIRENVQLIDVVPTVLDLAGIERGDLMLQGDSLVGLVEGRDRDHWRDRVVVSEEATAMEREAPCPCASFIYRDWHLVASSWMWRGRPLVRQLPDTPQALLQMRAYNFHEDPTEERLAVSFFPDLYLRWLQYDSATRLREAGNRIHDKLTADEKTETRLDPETLEHLRGLGYVN